MKVLLLIFSVYTLAISCLPCTDMKSKDIASTVVMSAAADSREHQHHNEKCSPLCTCSCCSTLGNYTSIASVNTSEIVFPTGKYPFNNTAVYSRNFSSIWQPPRV